jgi:hypothetical protein
MSIYATLWWLKFPRYGDEYVGCEWIRVSAQGVPAHVGTPTRGFGYEDGDPYADFLPPGTKSRHQEKKYAKGARSIPTSSPALWNRSSRGTRQKIIETRRSFSHAPASRER